MSFGFVSGTDNAMQRSVIWLQYAMSTDMPTLPLVGDMARIECSEQRTCANIGKKCRISCLNFETRHYMVENKKHIHIGNFRRKIKHVIVFKKINLEMIKSCLNNQIVRVKYVRDKQDGDPRVS